MSAEAPRRGRARAGVARRQVVIFVKVPRPGRVKTRLARGVGAPEAARWFRAQSRALIRRLRADPRWEVRLAVSPDAEGLTTRALPGGAARQAQGGGDLGARMARALFAAPPGPVLVIGADIPGVVRRREVPRCRRSRKWHLRMPTGLVCARYNRITTWETTRGRVVRVGAAQGFSKFRKPLKIRDFRPRKCFKYAENWYQRYSHSYTPLVTRWLRN